MAVYTDVDDQSLARFLADYEIGKLVAYRGIAEGVENSNFVLETGAGQFILTLYEKRVKRADLPFFLGLMDHLAAKGLACPTPIHRKDGRVLGELCGRPAAIVSFLKGVWPRKIELSHCAPVGDALARLHVAGADFPIRRENALGPAGWRPLAEACGARVPLRARHHAGSQGRAAGCGRACQHCSQRCGGRPRHHRRAWPRALPARLDEHRMPGRAGHHAIPARALQDASPRP